MHVTDEAAADQFVAAANAFRMQKMGMRPNQNFSDMPRGALLTLG